MKRNEFFNLISALFQFYRYKETPSSSVIDQWHTELDYIESNAIPFILGEMKEMDSLPRNLPKKIKEVHAMYRRQNPSQIFIKYDKYDDPRYPLEKLQTAFELLFANKETEFVEYCKRHYMPSQDIERVKNKCRMVRNKQMQDSETKISEMADTTTRELDWEPPETKPETTKIDFLNLEV